MGVKLRCNVIYIFFCFGSNNMIWCSFIIVDIIFVFLLNLKKNEREKERMYLGI